MYTCHFLSIYDKKQAETITDVMITQTTNIYELQPHQYDENQLYTCRNMYKPQIIRVPIIFIVSPLFVNLTRLLICCGIFILFEK